MLKKAIIIFVRPPVLGKVKSRIAATIGEERALNVYEKLLAHTHKICSALTCDRYVFYADEIVQEDCWEKTLFTKYVQTGSDLGDRMQHAFEMIFSKGYNQVLIIGSDCYELDTPLLETAFTALENDKVVIGPATDGGYYLLGLQQHLPFLFRKISWSTSTVCTETINRCRQQQLSIHILPVLTDIDEEKDIPFTY